MILRLVRRDGATAFLREHAVDPARPPELIEYHDRLYLKARGQFGRGWVAVYHETAPYRLDDD